MQHLLHWLVPHMFTGSCFEVLQDPWEASLPSLCFLHRSSKTWLWCPCPPVAGSSLLKRHSPRRSLQLDKDALRQHLKLPHWD